MTSKALPVLCLLTFAGVGFAADQSFHLSNSTTAGAQTLAEGDYQVKVKGDQAIITDARGKSVSIPVKIEQSTQKFSATLVSTAMKDGANSIKEIDLGGSKTKLLFGN